MIAPDEKKAITFHLEEEMNLWTQFHANLSNGCWDVSLKTTDSPDADLLHVVLRLCVSVTVKVAAPVEGRRKLLVYVCIQVCILANDAAPDHHAA